MGRQWLAESQASVSLLMDLGPVGAVKYVWFVYYVRLEMTFDGVWSV